MVVREMIATARERIAKFREAEKMVGARGGAERQREQEAAAHAHLKERGTCRLASPRGMDPESFTYEEKESYVRFAPFMGMRSCALEPRSEMQGLLFVRRSALSKRTRTTGHYRATQIRSSE